MKLGICLPSHQILRAGFAVLEELCDVSVDRESGQMNEKDLWSHSYVTFIKVQVKQPIDTLHWSRNTKDTCAIGLPF